MVVVLDRRAFRRQFLSMVARRQRPGAGSDLRALDTQRFLMDWWSSVGLALRGIPHAVVGAVAANAYAPPRATMDIDFAIIAADAPRAETALRAAGWRKTGELALIKGSNWRDRSGHALDLLVIEAPWASLAVSEAQDNLIHGLPTLPLPYLVVMKMTAARTIDLADVSRILGRASDVQVAAARRIVAQFGDREDIEDFDRLVRMGRLERGSGTSGADAGPS